MLNLVIKVACLLFCPSSSGLPWSGGTQVVEHEEGLGLHLEDFASLVILSWQDALNLDTP